MLVRFRRPGLCFGHCYLLVGISHCLWRAWPAPRISREQQEKVVSCCPWGCTNLLISVATLGESGRGSWKVKGSILYYLEALTAKHKQTVHGKKAYISVPPCFPGCVAPSLLMEISFEFFAHRFAVKILTFTICR